MATKGRNSAKQYADIQNQQRTRPAVNASRVLPAVLWDMYPDGKLPAPEAPAEEHDDPQQTEESDHA